MELDGDEAEVVGSYDVDKGVQITAAAIGDDRVFLGTGASGYYYGGGIAVDGVAAPPAVPSMPMEPGIAIGGVAVGATGTKAVVAAGWNGELSVIDASDATDPVVSRSVPVAGSARDLDIVGDMAIAALGTSGIQTIPLD